MDLEIIHMYEKCHCLLIWGSIRFNKYGSVMPCKVSKKMRKLYVKFRMNRGTTKMWKQYIKRCTSVIEIVKL